MVLHLPFWTPTDEIAQVPEWQAMLSSETEGLRAAPHLSSSLGRSLEQNAERAALVSVASLTFDISRYHGDHWKRRNGNSWQQRRFYWWHAKSGKISTGFKQTSSSFCSPNTLIDHEYFLQGLDIRDPRDIIYHLDKFPPAPDIGLQGTPASDLDLGQPLRSFFIDLLSRGDVGSEREQWVVQEKKDSSGENAPIRLSCPVRYKCPTCGLTKTNRDTIKAHIRKDHENAKPFACLKCDFATQNEDTFRRHNCEFTFCCKDCGKRLASKQSLINHASVHKEASFVCSFCGKQLKHKQGLERHIQRYHE